MTMKRLITWIICLALICSNVSVFAEENTEEAPLRSQAQTQTQRGWGLGCSPQGLMTREAEK